jgi:hypothetical protein
LSVLFSLEVASAEAGSQLLLIDRDLRPLALSSKGQWQLPPALGDAALPRGLDQAWLKTAQTGAVSEQRNNQLWSAMPLPWAQWTLLKVSNVQEWVPGVSVKMMGWLATALLVLAGLLGRCFA